MTLPSRNKRHAWLRFDTQDYTKEGIQDFKSMLGKIYNRQVHQVQFLNFDVLTEDMKQDMTERLTMEHTDAQGHDASLRVIASKAELRDYWTRISSSGDFLTLVPSYTLIREPLKRLCHRMIAFTIARRGQAPEKVTTTDLFFLRSMDEGTVVNVPYLLAQYLFRFSLVRKKGAQMSEGYFIVRLGVHFRVIMEESLQTLTMEVRGLTTIDIDELIRLRICEAAQVDPKAPQEDVAAGHEGVQSDLAHVQAPQAVAPIPRTIPQRLQRLEEEVHGLCESLGEQRMLLERMGSDQERFST
ncbi:hypothetical protein Tco_0421041 [Tanacetum coccineum]